jgi:hypothetical protein
LRIKKCKISAYQLEHVTVLEKAFLGNMGFLEFNTKIQILEHDGLDDLLGPCVGELFVAENFLKCIKSSSRLSNLDEF